MKKPHITEACADLSSSQSTPQQGGAFGVRQLDAALVCRWVCRVLKATDGHGHTLSSGASRRRVYQSGIKLPHSKDAARRMTHGLQITWLQWLQAAFVLGCALALKLFYATASADALRWILTPTAALVEAVTGVPFVYEAHAGYLSRERGFLIAASCAGVNFLFIAFLVLTLPRLWRGRLAWRFVPVAAVMAYLVTLMANAARICLALWWPRVPGDWLTHAQLHRCEGIMVYFGFLLLLFVVSERMRAETTLVFPLLLYYAATLGLPLLRRADRQGSDFGEHALAVLLMPLLLLLPLITFRLFRQTREIDRDFSKADGSTN